MIKLLLQFVINLDTAGKTITGFLEPEGGKTGHIEMQCQLELAGACSAIPQLGELIGCSSEPCAGACSIVRV